jgi:hypothetical protein
MPVCCAEADSNALVNTNKQTIKASVFGGMLSHTFPYPKNPHRNPPNYKKKKRTSFYIYQEAVFLLPIFFKKMSLLAYFQKEL